MEKQKLIEKIRFLILPLFIIVSLIGSYYVYKDVFSDPCENPIPGELLIECEFGVKCGNNGFQCAYPPCKTFMIEDKNCFREGMTGGFLDTNIYWICEDYGRVVNSCVEHYSSMEEFMEDWK